MMVLSLNCGSSSLKAALFRFDGKQKSPQVLLRLTASQLSSPSAVLRWEDATGKVTKTSAPAADHKAALEALFAHIDGLAIDAVGHRVTHGGETFGGPTLLDEVALEEVRRCTPFAPLHNPLNLLGIEIVAALRPSLPQIASFDTAYHRTIPRAHRLYALPHRLTEAHGFQRFGFHGISHHGVARVLAQQFSLPVEQITAISCHLGNGCSLCAIDEGRSIDTTMGFTPLEGLVMGTRSGSLDAGLLLELQRREKLSSEETLRLLNRESGLLGLDGQTSDMREILARCAANEPRAIDARDVFVASLRRHLGAMLGSLRRPPQAICFTGGIGENAAEIRQRALDQFPLPGLRLSPERNQQRPEREPILISADNSSIAVFVIPADEERTIAEDAAHLLARD